MLAGDNANVGVCCVNQDLRERIKVDRLLLVINNP
jgi:hypothetical protein